jgi:hypothetical protein
MQLSTSPSPPICETDLHISKAMSHPPHLAQYWDMKGSRPLRRQEYLFSDSRRESMSRLLASAPAHRANNVEEGCTCIAQPDNGFLGVKSMERKPNMPEFSTPIPFSI